MPNAGHAADIHARIISQLKQHPEGISINDLRRALGLGVEEQQHLDRRVRDLDATYTIRRERCGRDTRYVLEGKRDLPLDAASIDKTLRARILHLNNYQCQMCGRSPEHHGIVLHIDHRIPREWGGKTDEDNLWALCADCNEGKRAFFASITDPEMQRAMTDTSVHKRIGELLKAHAGKPVPKENLKIVASTHDDWEKRLRELRELGWEFHSVRRVEGGRVHVSFVLDHWEPWPLDDPARSIRAAERAKRSKR